MELRATRMHEMHIGKENTVSPDITEYGKMTTANAIGRGSRRLRTALSGNA